MLPTNRHHVAPATQEPIPTLVCVGGVWVEEITSQVARETLGGHRHHVGGHALRRPSFFEMPPVSTDALDERLRNLVLSPKPK
ncbi:MAG: hypothetical protein KBC64_02525 [Simkaniaceae bacterium]|nr:hypothetical protein [Simkaniaceae bacterium]